MCCRLFILIPLLFWSADHNGQSPPANPIGNLVYVQSANFEDMKAWADKISRNASALKIDPFKTVLAQHNDVQNGTYEDLRVDVVMYDPFRIGTRILIKPNPMTADDYIQYWNGKVTGDRILFFFQKPSRDAGDYDFKRLKASPELENKQLPDFITRYIEKNILTKTKTSEETLKAGINALKNAFDQQFKERLQEIGPVELTNDIYKVNHVNWGPQYTYELIGYHQNHANDTINRIYILNHLSSARFEPDFLANFELVPVSDYIDWSDITSKSDNAFSLKINFLRFPTSIYNYLVLNQSDLKDTTSLRLLKEVNIRYRDTILYYPSALQSYFPSKDSKGNEFHSRRFLNTEIKRVAEDPNHIEISNNNVNGLNLHTTSTEISNLRLIDHGCRLKFLLKKIDAGDSLNLRDRDVILGRTISHNKEYIRSLTWCNLYVGNMSKLIFPANKRNYGLWDSELSANGIYDDLQKDSSFINVTEYSFKWQLVNCGYIMFIVFKNSNGSGHIELGWPDENEISQMTIGAGSTIGKKSFTSSFNNPKITKSFNSCDQKLIKYYIYLGFMKSKDY